MISTFKGNNSKGYTVFRGDELMLLEEQWMKPRWNTNYNFYCLEDLINNLLGAVYIIGFFHRIGDLMHLSLWGRV